MGSGSPNDNKLNRPQNRKDKILECTFYQNGGMNEYICQLDVNIPNSAPPEFIFIIDKSGSMGSTYNYIISKTIPEVLNSLGYKDRKIHLITFDDDVNYLNVSQSELRKINGKSGGRTYMSKSYQYLETILYSLAGKCNNLRILAILMESFMIKMILNKEENYYIKLIKIFLILIHKVLDYILVQSNLIHQESCLF